MKLPTGARPAPFPAPLAPMMANLARAPFSDPAWLFEPKLDGVRMLAYVRADGSVRLNSRRGQDNTATYPGISEALRVVLAGRDAVVDGEIVALDDQGRPSFQLLQGRINLTGAADIQRAEEAIPASYYLFDLLYLDGHDLRGVAIEERKRLLTELVSNLGPIRLVEHFEEDGETAYDAAVSIGLEGLVAKRRGSRYEVGRRSPAWLKVKATLRDEFVIGGYTRGEGSRSDSFGSLLLGSYDEAGQLVYVGNVGTGFDQPQLRTLVPRLERLKARDNPFAALPTKGGSSNGWKRAREIVWVRPDLVAEVKFANRTEGGHLRAPVFLRLRDDKSPTDIQTAADPPLAANLHAHQRQEASVPELAAVIDRLRQPAQKMMLEVDGHELSLTNLDKVLWPPTRGLKEGLTKRDLLVYLATVSPYLLPHLRDRPVTLIRYPDGIQGGERFFQRHLERGATPPFLETVRVVSKHGGSDLPYLLCNNLATLLWFGQMGALELHSWYSRTTPSADAAGLPTTFTSSDALERSVLNHPDFLVFDLDPYLYSGKEASGAEPELNRKAFRLAVRAALWLRELLTSLGLPAYVKTTGRTGLHIFVPIRRDTGMTYQETHAAAETLAHYLVQEHPRELTAEWAVRKRTGKIFLDYNQNARSKTLAAIYSPRAAPGAPVSVPVRWEELEEGSVYPTAFSIRTAPDRLDAFGDPWADILEPSVKSDLKAAFQLNQAADQSQSAA